MHVAGARRLSSLRWSGRPPLVLANGCNSRLGHLELERQPVIGLAIALSQDADQLHVSISQNGIVVVLANPIAFFVHGNLLFHACGRHQLVATMMNRGLPFLRTARWPARMSRCVPRTPIVRYPCPPPGLSPFAFAGLAAKMPSIELRACSSKDGRIQPHPWGVFKMGRVCTLNHFKDAVCCHSGCPWQPVSRPL